jgi:hypothetical protein
VVMPPKTLSSASEWAAKIIKNKVGDMSIERCLAVQTRKLGCGQDRGIPVRVLGGPVDMAWSAEDREDNAGIYSGLCTKMHIFMLHVAGCAALDVCRWVRAATFSRKHGITVSVCILSRESQKESLAHAQHAEIDWPCRTMMRFCKRCSSRRCCLSWMQR